MATVIDRLSVIFGADPNLNGLRRFDKALQATRQKMSALGTRALVAGTAVAGPMAAIAKSAYNTDEAFRQLQARSGATAKEMGAFREQAYGVAGDMPLMIADILNAQTAFFQLGNSVQETLDTIPGLSAFATAAQDVDTAMAASFAGQIKNQWGIAGDAIGGALDVLLKAETITPALAYNIGQSFQYAGQSAADAGVGLETYVAAVGTLAGSGREIEASAQGLNVAFAKFAKAGTDIGRGGKLAEKALKSLGFTSEELQSMLQSGPRGFETFVSDLGTKVDTGVVSLKDLNAALSSLVGESYMSAFSYLVQNHEKLVDVSNQLLESEGESFRQVGVLMGEGLSGAWKSFTSQLNILMNRLADMDMSLESLIRRITDFIKKLIEVNDAGELVRSDMLKNIVLAGKLGTSLIGVGIALKAISLGIGVFQSLIAPIRAVQVALLKTEWGAKRAWLSILGPIGLAIGAITLVFAAFKPIRTFLVGGLQAIKDGWRKLIPPMKNVLKALGPIGKWLQSLFTSDATASGYKFFTMLIEGTASFINWIADAIRWVSDLGSTLERWGQNVDNVMSNVRGFFSRFWEGLKAAPGILLELGKQAVANWIEAWVGMWERVATFFHDMWEGIATWFHDLWDLAFEAGRTFIQTFVDGITSLPGIVGNALKGIFTKEITPVAPSSDAKKGPLRNLTKWGESVVTTMTTGIRRASPGLGHQFADSMGGMLTNSLARQRKVQHDVAKEAQKWSTILQPKKQVSLLDMLTGDRMESIAVPMRAADWQAEAFQRMFGVKGRQRYDQRDQSHRMSMQPGGAVPATLFASLEAAPQTTPLVAQSAGGANVNVGDIRVEVNTGSGDADEIGKVVGREIKRTIRHTFEQADSMVRL